MKNGSCAPYASRSTPPPSPPPPLPYTHHRRHGRDLTMMVPPPPPRPAAAIAATPAATAAVALHLFHLSPHPPATPTGSENVAIFVRRVIKCGISGLCIATSGHTTHAGTAVRSYGARNHHRLFCGSLGESAPFMSVVCPCVSVVCPYVSAYLSV